MRPVYSRPGFARRQPIPDLTGTLIVSIVLLAIVVAGLFFIIAVGGGA